MRLVRMNKRSRYKGLDCMYCNRLVVDGRVAVCSTLYVYPNERGGAFTFSYSVKDMIRRRVAGAEPVSENEIQVRVVWHRKCLEKILTNPRGPFDPEVEASMYDEYREQLLERFEERKPGSVRYPSEAM